MPLGEFAEEHPEKLRLRSRSTRVAASLYVAVTWPLFAAMTATAWGVGVAVRAFYFRKERKAARAADAAEKEDAEDAQAS